MEEENASVVGEVKVSNELFSLDKFKKKTVAKTGDLSTKTNIAEITSFDINGITAKGDGQKFDVTIIGAGPAGYKAATLIATQGHKVAIIESDKMGGTCVNIGCIPVKTFIKTQKTIVTIKKAATLNVINQSSKIAVDLAALQVRKNAVTTQISNMVGMVVKSNKVTKFAGTAEIIDQHNIKVKDQKITTKIMIIATGAKPTEINKTGFKEARQKGLVIDSTAVLNLTKLPKKIIILAKEDITGPIIDINFASILNDFGSDVTLIKESETLMTKMDADLQKFAKDLLIKQGVKVELGLKIIKIDNKGTLRYLQNGKEKSLKADLFIDASGRIPRVPESVKNLKLALGLRGEILVNNQMQTSISNIFAIGDVIGHDMLAHEAYKHGSIAAGTITNKFIAYKRHMIPKMVYLLPEIATVGYTEKELKAQNIKYKTTDFSNKFLGKAIADNETDGYIKIMYDPKYKQVLGAKIISPNAINLISQFGLAMELETTLDEIKETIYPHPSTSELIWSATTK